MQVAKMNRVSSGARSAVPVRGPLAWQVRTPHCKPVAYKEKEEAILNNDKGRAELKDKYNQKEAQRDNEKKAVKKPDGGATNTFKESAVDKGQWARQDHQSQGEKDILDHDKGRGESKDKYAEKQAELDKARGVNQPAPKGKNNAKEHNKY